MVEGNVGIGTASPDTKLFVEGTIKSRGVVSVNAAGSANNGRTIEIVADNGGVGQIYSSYWSTEGPLVLGTYANRANQLYLATSGNVGIGTASPNAKLEVYSSVDNGFSGIRINNPSGAANAFMGIDFYNSSNYHGRIFGERATNNFYVRNTQTVSGDLKLQTNNGAAELTLKKDGNVGIGTTSPGYTLTVNGTAWCTGGAWASDLRWKKNIATLNNPLDKLLRLRGVEFDWKRKEFKDKNFPEGRQIGIIAQELEKEFPELVITDKEGYKAIAYGSFTAVLLEAIKTQAGKMDAQASKLNAQQNQLDAQASQIEGLRKQGQGYSLPPTISSPVASDSRLKKDIRPYTNGLSIIKQINPVYFKYNGKAGFPDDDNQEHIGVIAQEIVKVAPYTVNTFKAKLNSDDKKETELLNFNSHALIFDLINAVKELDSNITKLTQENQDLKKDNQGLRSEVENLKTRLNRLEARIK